MKYPMEFSIEPNTEYPYCFSFDLLEPGPMPKDQIPHLKNMVDTWLNESEIYYRYQTGLFWRLKNEQDALMFRLRFA